MRERGPYWCCGLNCLAFVAHSNGVRVPFSSLEELLQPGDRGTAPLPKLSAPRPRLDFGLSPRSFPGMR